MKLKFRTINFEGHIAAVLMKFQINIFSERNNRYFDMRKVCCGNGSA